MVLIRVSFRSASGWEPRCSPVEVAAIDDGFCAPIDIGQAVDRSFFVLPDGEFDAFALQLRDEFPEAIALPEGPVDTLANGGEVWFVVVPCSP